MYLTNYNKCNLKRLLVLSFLLCHGCGSGSESSDSQDVSTMPSSKNVSALKEESPKDNLEHVNSSLDKPTAEKEQVDGESSQIEEEKVESKKVDSEKSKNKGKNSKPEVLSLDEKSKTKLLNERVDLKLVSPFERLSKTALVSSSNQLDFGIYPATKSQKISFAKIVDTNPQFYKPTIREFLNNIAIQTKSTWTSSSNPEFLNSDLDYLKIKKDIVVFEFKEGKRKLPYSIELAKGWSKENLGLMLKVKPNDCPLGLDIFDLGTFSSSNEVDKVSFFEKVRKEVAMMWAKRISKNRNLSSSVFSRKKVGKYNALYFQKDIPTKIGYRALWRQWVFTVDNRCYLAASVIYPSYEKRLYPQVLAMLKSFKASN